MTRAVYGGPPHGGLVLVHTDSNKVAVFVLCLALVPLAVDLTIFSICATHDIFF